MTHNLSAAWCDCEYKGVCMCRRVGVYLHASLCVWALTPASVSF